MSRRPCSAVRQNCSLSCKSATPKIKIERVQPQTRFINCHDGFTLAAEMNGSSDTGREVQWQKTPVFNFSNTFLSLWLRSWVSTWSLLLYSPILTSTPLWPRRLDIFSARSSITRSTTFSHSEASTDTLQPLHGFMVRLPLVLSSIQVACFCSQAFLISQSGRRRLRHQP